MSKKQIAPGDVVRFLNDVGGGKVTAILNKEMVSVETEDGFEIPTYIRNLVVVEQSSDVHASSGRSEDRKMEQGVPQEVSRNKAFQEVNQLRGNDEPSFLFAGVAENPGNPPAGKIELYLVNDCNYTLMYHFSLYDSSTYVTIDAGFLESNTKVSLESILPGKHSELPAYCFQLMFFRKNGTTLEEPIQKEVRISPLKFYKPNSFVKNRYFEKPALLISLVDHPLKAELEKLTDKDLRQIAMGKEETTKPSSKLPVPELKEVDLHIQQLLDHTAGMTNADMLKHQMEAFRKEMEAAILSGIKRVVFIHGVGDGVLKKELRGELQRKYKKFPFQDASFREYGFGATLVILRR
ncbi:MAG: DUF2027 domain-containing protein [Marinilabiliales bacterium]|nr:DUF2027 domain-containing protein [Marinilabiliales bacterium]